MPAFSKLHQVEYCAALFSLSPIEFFRSAVQCMQWLVFLCVYKSMVGRRVNAM
jgi:hypothetical protein